MEHWPFDRWIWPKNDRKAVVTPDFKASEIAVKSEYPEYWSGCRKGGWQHGRFGGGSLQGGKKTLFSDSWRSFISLLEILRQMIFWDWCTFGWVIPLWILNFDPFAPLCFSNLQIRFQQLFCNANGFFSPLSPRNWFWLFSNGPRQKDMNKDWTASQEAVPNRRPSCWFPKVWCPQGSSILGFPDFSHHHLIISYHLQVAVFLKMCKETPWGNLGMKHLGVRSDVRNIDCAAWPRTWWKNSVRRVVWTVLVGFAAKKASHPLAVFFRHFFGVRRTLYFCWCPWYSI